MTLFSAQVQPVVDGRAAHAKHTMCLHFAQPAIHHVQHFQSEIFTVAASHKSSVAYISLLAIIPYIYTGDDKYAGEVKRLLVALAKDYPNYPARRDCWGHEGLLAPLGGVPL